MRRQARNFLRSYARYRPPEIDRRLGALAAVIGRADPSLFAVSDLTRYEQKVFSQNGEDGVLVEIFNRIGTGNRFFVEFGIQNGTEGNAVLLADVFGWAGLFIEADPDDFAQVEEKYAGSQVRVVRDLVTAASIGGIFAAADVPEEFDLLSIDIDGNDVYVWDALGGYRPRVVVIEYNAGIVADRPLAQPHDPERAWDGSGAFGSNLSGLEVVASRKGYRLAHSDLTGTNAFFVRDDLWGALGIDRAPRRTQNFGLTGIRQEPKEPPGGWVPVDQPSPE